jgi:multidrug resistance efflux pump
MRNDLVVDLADCTVFRQTLLARPPRLAHATTVLLVGLLAMATLWAWLTTADLVVRARGRVRPLTAPQKVFSSGRAESLSASTAGRVVDVYFREGDEVKKDVVLVRLETNHLDNDIAKERQTIQAAEKELADLADLEALTARQLKTARGKAAAELAHAQEELEQAKERRALDIRLALVELENARDENARESKLYRVKATSAADLGKAHARMLEAHEKYTKTALPVSVVQVEIAARALEQVESDYAVKLKELALKQQLKQSELAAFRIGLANRELERKQSEIRAPIAGIITKGDVKVGEVLEPGKPVVEIAPQTGLLFEVAVASEDIGHLRVGMPVRIKLDAYDSQRFGAASGKVCFLSPDSGQAEGKTQPTYTVKIALDTYQLGRGELQAQIKLGMAGQADIVTERQSLLVLLVQRIRQTISLG